jgi:hypothetical protein
MANSLYYAGEKNTDKIECYILFDLHMLTIKNDHTLSLNTKTNLLWNGNVLL